jgi:RNA polymerase sigma-70 factor, ECF subfamily
MEPESERELLAACKKGSHDAFKILVEKNYRLIYSMALYWTHNREAALDISQEAFIRVHRNLKNFDITKSFRAWLHTIVKNLSFNYLRRSRKRWVVFSDFFTGNRKDLRQTDETQRKIEAEETSREVWRALRQLKPEEREIVLLRDFENFSYQEISEALEIPPGTVMSRLFYARKKLSKILKENEIVK